ncbi:hypothetical protein GGR50DRAFT_180273 [Xylaria sp. CBS 124048]|nr:hypothetical protein GGR50DRAFT_180273 [Xylaria sp. CBS 124048]
MPSMLGLLILALSAAAGTARPTLLNFTSGVVPSNTSLPVTYPLEGGGCTNEWLYLNFNPNSTIDNTRLRKLHGIICSGEMRAITSSGAASAGAGDLVYQRYFPANTTQDDFQGHVNSVLTKIAGENVHEGQVGEIVGTFIIDNFDFAGICGPQSPSYAFKRLAYTTRDRYDNFEKTHFCNIAWSRPSLDKRSKECDGLGPYPSTGIDTFSRLALREMVHYSSVGPNSTLGQSIGDVLNADCIRAYEPSRVHGLLDEDQDNNPALAEINADSYAWMAVESWLNVFCSNSTTASDVLFFTEDPPPYGSADDYSGDYICAI